MSPKRYSSNTAAVSAGAYTHPHLPSPIFVASSSHTRMYCSHVLPLRSHLDGLDFVQNERILSGIMMVAADFEDENSERMINRVSAEVLMVGTYKDEWVIITSGRILRLGTLHLFLEVYTSTRHLSKHIYTQNNRGLSPVRDTTLHV
jgi:hypothetical protein